MIEQHTLARVSSLHARPLMMPHQQPARSRKPSLRTRLRSAFRAFASPATAPKETCC